MDGIEIMRRIHERGVGPARARSEHPTGRGILALLSGLIEEERTRILRHANHGRVAAIKRGTKLGGRSRLEPKLDDHQQRQAIARLKAGESCRRSLRPSGSTMQLSRELAG
jgi:DNA invertase Pin-like site-specific DNA recombinase